MYYEYWGLTKAPFDNVPDPTMYVDSHASVETAVAETLFAIEEGNECVAVIVGDVGSGKTLSLRLILDALDHEKYKIVFITNPDMSFVQLLREIIGQILGREFEAGEKAKRKIDLLEVFNKLLFETVDEGKKVLIFIDEANAISPSNLESLRLLTNMQDDSKNLFTLVLAGQMELARRLEHPRRANLFQRIGTYNRIEKIESADVAKDYIQKRLYLAGGRSMFFTDEAIREVWKYSEQGVPRLINKICKLCMKAGETNNFSAIGADMVTLVAERFQKLMRPSSIKEKARKKAAEVSSVRPQAMATQAQESPQTMIAMEPSIGPLPESRAEVSAPAVEAAEPPVAVAEARAEAAEDQVAPPAAAVHAPAVTFEPAAESEEATCEAPAESEEVTWEAQVDSTRITIDIPRHILQEARSCTRETRMKLAGALAAETLQKHGQFTLPTVKDPVAIWHDIRDSIFHTLERDQQARSA